MLRVWQFNVLIALGIVVLLLVIANGVLFTQNRGAQAEISGRQQFLQQTVGLEALYRDIVKALAELATKNNDQQLLRMLAGQGINVTVTSPGISAPLAAPPASGGKR